MFGIARNFRSAHGEEKFAALAKVVFTDADADNSGGVDSNEVRALLKRLGMLLVRSLPTLTRTRQCVLPLNSRPSQRNHSLCALLRQTDEQALSVVEHYDTNHDGILSENEWLVLVSDLVDGSFESVNHLQAASPLLPAGQPVALRSFRNGGSADSAPTAGSVARPLTRPELTGLAPTALSAFVLAPGNAARLAAAIEAGGVSGEELANVLHLPTTVTNGSGPPAAATNGSAAAAGSIAAGSAAAADAAAAPAPETPRTPRSDEEEAERRELVLQYEAWGKPKGGGALFAKWGTDAPLSEWGTLGVDGASGRVVKLGTINGVELGRGGHSYIREELCRALPQLRDLTLYACEMGGTLDPLALCTRLVTVHLGNNEMAGTLEPLSQLVGLRTLKLNDNCLTGTLDPLRKCVHLHTAVLSSNKFVGTLEGLGACSELAMLDLAFNELACDLAPLAGCTALETLLLSGNVNITSSVTPLHGLKQIKKADLRSTNVKSTAADRKLFGHRLTCAARPMEEPPQPPAKLDDAKAASTIAAAARGRASRKGTGKKASK